MRNIYFAYLAQIIHHTIQCSYLINSTFVLQMSSAISCGHPQSFTFGHIKIINADHNMQIRRYFEQLFSIIILYDGQKTRISAFLLKSMSYHVSDDHNYWVYSCGYNMILKVDALSVIYEGNFALNVRRHSFAQMILLLFIVTTVTKFYWFLTEIRGGINVFLANLLLNSLKIITSKNYSKISILEYHHLLRG